MRNNLAGAAILLMAAGAPASVAKRSVPSRCCSWPKTSATLSGLQCC